MKKIIVIYEMEKDIQRLSVVSDRFSKIGSSVETPKTNIIDFFNNYLEYMRKRIPKTVDLITEFNDEKVYVNINAPLFSWVIENLIKNSADALGGKGKILLSLEKTSTEIILKIKDNGKGIPLAIQKTIFQPGYTTKERGWGLGLSLAKRIVEGHHKGKIYIITSKEGEGTTIGINLPILN